MRFLAALAATTVLLWTRNAAAQKHDVSVAIAGDPDPRATEATLRDLFAHLPDAPPPTVGLDVAIVAQIEPRSITDPPPDPPPVFARVWIDMRADVCIVSIADAKWERIYLRRMPRPAGQDDITREQVVQVVVSAVETMLAGGVIGVARETLAPAAPRAPSPSESGSPSPLPKRPVERRALRPIVSIAVGYEALAFSGSTRAHGPWSALRGAIPLGAWTAGLTVSAQWRAPITVDAAPVGVRLDAQAFRLMFDVERPLARHVALHAALGGGLDVLTIEPRGVGSDDGSVTIESKRTRTTGILRSSVGVDVRLATSLHVGIAAVVDVDPTDRSYFINQDGMTRSILSPFVFRPGLAIGVHGDLLH